jgi:hypothetical protein
MRAESRAGTVRQSSIVDPHRSRCAVPWMKLSASDKGVRHFASAMRARIWFRLPASAIRLPRLCFE